MADNLSRVNSVVLGPTGSGKSSLISALVSYSGPDLSSFDTSSHRIFLTEVASREDLITQSIASTYLQSCTLLVVSAADTDFDDGSLDAQVRDQIAISKTLGAASTIVTVTHMDDVAWSQDRFSAISQAIVSCAKDVGSDPGEITIIPITAVGDNPDNLFEKSSASSWYEGVTLLDAMDALQAPPDLSTGSLRCSVEGVFRIKGVGDVLTGKVIRGTMVPNSEILFSPTHSAVLPCTGKVFTIERAHRKQSEANVGDRIGVNVKNLNRDNMPHNGDVAGLTTSDPPQSAKSFTATVTIVDSATELNASSTLLFNGISRTATKVSQILSKTSPSNGGAVEQNPTTVGAGETATVVFSSFNRLPVETLASCPAMGRFTAISGDKIVAAGSITDVAYNN